MLNKKLSNKKHWDCKNCNCVEKVKFKNNVIFCFGLIKQTYYKEDYYRFCIIKGKKRSAHEIMLEELYSMLMGLSSILFQKRLTDLKKT